MTFDLRWKAATGIAIDIGGFHFSGLSYWRGKIERSARPDRISAVIGRVVAECGVLKGKRSRALDSTIIDDSVARQDTYTLLARQVRAVGKAIPQLTALIGSLPGAEYYKPGAGRPDIDWCDAASRDALVSLLVGDAKTVKPELWLW